MPLPLSVNALCVLNVGFDKEKIVKYRTGKASDVV